MVLAALLLSGCAGAPPPAPVLPTPANIAPATAVAGSSPSHTVSPDPSPAPIPVHSIEPPPTGGPPTPPPTAPVVPLPRAALTDRDGIRVRIVLDRNPMPAGEVTGLTVEVRNTGRDDVVWFHDGCATLVGTWGVMAQAWRPGTEHDGQAGTFKARALDWAYRPLPHPGPIITFVPEDRLGKGAYGCADIGMSDLVRPGQTLRQRHAWDGMAWMRWGPPLTGPVTLTGTFGMYWRGSREAMPDNISERRIDVTLDAWITGGAAEAWLSPPEVVDAALADPAFVAYLEAQNLGSGREEILWYDQQAGLWEVGILAWYDGPKATMHLLMVDPNTGEVRDTVDRPWDQERDGFP